MAQRVFCGFLLVTAALAAAAGVCFGFEAPVFVPLGESIQSAIDVAAPGTVIELGEGTYRESLVIDRSLTLRGSAGGTTIEGTARGAAVRIRGEGITVRLENLTVQGGRGWDGHGIQTEGSPAVGLVGVTTRENSWCGIWAKDRSLLSLEACRIVGNGTHGIYTWDFARLDLRSCEISGNKTHGILALHVSELCVADCTISGNLSGVWAWDGARFHATRTAIGGNTLNGLVGQNAAQIDLASCSVSENGQYGLWFSDSSRGVLQDCEIRANGADGAFVEMDGIVEFSRCVVRENSGVGIRAATPSCVGSFDPSRPFKGWIEGEGNDVPGPEEEGGNLQGGLCPSYPGSLWPQGFLIDRPA